MGPIVILFAALVFVGTLPHWIPQAWVEGLGVALLVILVAVCVKVILELFSR